MSLGKPNVANVDLSDPKIEDVLKAMPVDSLGVKGRYTVGERAITSVLDIVSNINAGKIDPQRLRLSELAQMLICVAAEYKRQLLGGMQTDVSGNNYLAENINVFYLNGCMYGMRGTDVVAILNSEELLEAFKKTKEAFIPQKPMDLAELMTNPKKFELDSFQAGLKGGDGWGDS